MAKGKGRRRLIAGVALALALVGGGVAWALWPEPPAPEEADLDNDTGNPREKTEELMRTIGYVQ